MMSPLPRAFWLFALLLLLCLPACGSTESSKPAPGETESEQDGDLNLTENDAEADATEDDPQAKFVVAVLADPHIIDEFYHGTESTPLDTESLQRTAANLSAMGETLNGYTTLLPLKHVIFVGDIVHNLPFNSYEAYQSQRTRFDNAHDILATFKMPVHLALGNHDYDLGQLDHATTHRLFKEKLNTEPYSAFEQGGFRFILLNNYLGASCSGPESSCDKGSLGTEQLAWLQNLLKDGKPTLLFMHVMLSLMEPEENGQPGLTTLLKSHPEVRMVLSGHSHNWMSFGTKYGPEHWVVASTRYEKRAVMLLELDPKSGEIRFLNEACIKKYSYITKTYDTRSGTCREE